MPSETKAQTFRSFSGVVFEPIPTWTRDDNDKRVVNGWRVRKVTPSGIRWASKLKWDSLADADDHARRLAAF